METEKQYPADMLRIAANMAELMFTKHAGRLFDDNGQYCANDNTILNMLTEAVARGILQGTTDPDKWDALSITLEILYP